MKRFISIFVSLCIIVSCLCFASFGDESGSDIEVVSNSGFYRGQLTFFARSPGTTGYSTVLSVDQYLPSLSGIWADTSLREFSHGDLILTSDSNFDGYYSVYLCLTFFSTNSQAYFTGTPNANFLDWNLTAGNRSFTPTVRFNDYPVDLQIPNYHQIRSFWIKWDIEADNVDTIASTLNYNYSFTGSPNDTFIIAVTNFSIIKYNDASSNSDSDNLQNIAESLVDINNSLSNNIPQIVQFLDNISSNSDLTIDKLIDIYDQSENAAQSLYLIYQFLNTNFTLNGSSSGTMFNLLYTIYTQFIPTSSSSLLYRLFNHTRYPYIFNFDPITDSDPTITDNQVSGYLDLWYRLLSSINYLLLYDYKQNDNLKNSAGYQTGESLTDSINSNNGFSSVGDIGGTISGIGDISVVGRMFNGVGSAFRWFTQETMNNIDNVPLTRGPISDPIITHYYQDNINEALNILYGEEETESD